MAFAMFGALSVLGAFEESEIISLSEVWALKWDRAEFESGFFTYQLFDL